MIPIINFGVMMRKFSRQREIILEILQKSYSHPTAQEVLEEARLIDNNISLGTIYRNLELLCSDKTIEKISTPIGIDRYDLKKSHHSHAICERCGCVFDFDTNLDINKIKKELLKQVDVEMSHDEIRIIGICKNCKTL